MNQVRAGAVLSFLLITITTFAGILYTPFLLRQLGQTEYGLYSLAASIIAYLVLFDLGFGASITRFTAKFNAENQINKQYKMFGMFIILYSVISLIVAICGFFIVNNMASLMAANTDPVMVDRAKKIVFILIGNLCVTFPMSVFGAVLNAYERFVFVKTLGIIRFVLQIAIMIPLLLWGYKAVALAVLITVLNLLMLFANAVYCFAKIKIKIIFTGIDWKLLKEIGVFSFFIFLNAVMTNFHLTSGQFILGYCVGLNAAALYAVALVFIKFYITLSAELPSVLLPKIVNIVVKDKSTKMLSELFIKVGRLQFYVISVMFAGFGIFGKKFISFWAGADYENAYFIILIFMAAHLLPMIQNSAIEILKAQNRLFFRSISLFLFSVSGLVLAFWWSYRYVEIGCALGKAVSIFLGNGVFMNFYYWKKIGLNVAGFYKEISGLLLTIVLTTSGMTFCYWYFKMWETWTMYLLGIASFVTVTGGLYWFICMNEYEKGLFKELFNKVFFWKMKKVENR